MTEEIKLDFNLNEKEVECLEIHSLFKQKRVYDGLKDVLEDDDIDYIKVWYDAQYNDNWYDLTPVYFDIIKDNKVISKYSATSNYYGGDIEIRTDVEEGNMLSFLITPKMIK